MTSWVWKGLTLFCIRGQKNNHPKTQKNGDERLHTHGKLDGIKRPNFKVDRLLNYGFQFTCSVIVLECSCLPLDNWSRNHVARHPLFSHPCIFLLFGIIFTEIFDHRQLRQRQKDNVCVQPCQSFVAFWNINWLDARTTNAKRVEIVLIHLDWLGWNSIG